MTELQQARARALYQCRLPAHGGVKRFVEQMLLAAYNPDLALIHPNQDKALAGYCWHFREQLRGLGHGELVPPENPYTPAAPVKQDVLPL